MKLSTYLKPLSQSDREVLAVTCGTTFWHLRNVAFSGKPCGIELAVRLEQVSQAAVRRWDMRPDDWHRIWPELIGADGAPDIPQEVRDAA